MFLIFLICLITSIQSRSLPGIIRKGNNICNQIHNGICYFVGDFCPQFLTDEINSKNGQKTCGDENYRCCLPKTPSESVPRLTEKCGTSVLQNELLIFGGHASKVHEYPWQVSLSYRNEHLCGGSVISKTHILTAAHCFIESKKPSEWMAHAGLHYLSEYMQTSGPRNYSSKIQSREIKEIILHPFFEKPAYANDIAILILKRPFHLNDYVNVVCLPEPDEDFSNSICSSTGFGDREDRELPENLQVINVPIINNYECARRHCLNHEKLPIYNGNICAGFLEGLRDACQGDSGGPLVCRKGNQWVLAGITSHGSDCGKERIPGIYTRTSAYIGWIEFITGFRQTLKTKSLALTEEEFDYREFPIRRMIECEGKERI